MNQDLRGIDTLLKCVSESRWENGEIINGEFYEELKRDILSYRGKMAIRSIDHYINEYRLGKCGINTLNTMLKNITWTIYVDYRDIAEALDNYSDARIKEVIRPEDKREITHIRSSFMNWEG